MNIQFWVSSKRAKELGCTHRAYIFGIVPGFISETEMFWVSRSDLFNPIEDLLALLWITMRRVSGEEEDFMFAVGRRIE